MDAIKQKDRQTDCKMEVCWFFFFWTHHLIIMIYIFKVFHEAVLNYCWSREKLKSELDLSSWPSLWPDILKSLTCIFAYLLANMNIWHQFGKNIRNHGLEKISEMLRRAIRTDNTRSHMTTRLYTSLQRYYYTRPACSASKSGCISKSSEVVCDRNVNAETRSWTHLY